MQELWNASVPFVDKHVLNLSFGQVNSGIPENPHHSQLMLLNLFSSSFSRAHVYQWDDLHLELEKGGKCTEHMFTFSGFGL